MVSMTDIWNTLTKLQSTLNLLEARPPSRETVVDSDLVEQVSLSKIRSLVHYYHSLGNIPVLFTRIEDESITGMYLTSDDEREVVFFISHSKTGYRIDFDFNGRTVRKFYPHAKPKKVIQELVAGCRKMINGML